MTFFGSSFIADESGNKVEEMDRTTEGFILHTFDLDEIARKRYSWGVWRDRRVDLYSPILKMDDSE
jgi:N-carbamoylputrescine amidase